MVVVGEFSCFELADGRWRAVAQLRDDAGRKLKAKTIERKSEDLARREMTRWLKDRNRLSPSVSMTVSAMCDAYIDRCEKRGRVAGTIRGYRNMTKGYIVPSIGHIQILALKPPHVEAMLEGLPTKAAINTRAFLRAAINRVGKKAEPSLPNVASIAEPPSYRVADCVQLTPKNFAQIMKTEEDPLRKTLWLLLADSGLRPIEARELTWPEVVRKDDGYWIRLKASKTRAGLSPIPLTSASANALISLGKTSIFVFPSDKTGKPLNERTIRDYWRLAQEIAGVPVTNLYQLRHFFGTIMAAKVKDDVLARLMRHTDSRTSKQYYVHPFDEDLRRAIEE